MEYENVKLYPEYFNDVFGPISNPGSSSHMSGPCRAGYMANSLLGGPVSEIHIELDPKGAFNEGFGQMNEDVGMLNGAFGMLPDADGFFEIKSILDRKGIIYDFTYAALKEGNHPNLMRFRLKGHDGREVCAVISSIGGGMVETVTVEGFPFACRGDSWVLLVRLQDADRAAGITNEISVLDGIVDKGSISKDGEMLLWFKLEEEPAWEGTDEPGIEAYVMKPVLPVLTTRNKKPQKFKSMTEWADVASKEDKTLYDVAVEYEADASGWSNDEVIRYMREVVEHHMDIRIHALYEDESLLIKNPFRKIYYREWENAMSDGRLVGGVTGRAIRYMHSAQAMLKGVLDVPGPMSNGGGYLYSVLQAVREEYGLSGDDVTRGVFIAAGIGAIAYTRTEPTGEIIGCAGECGVCAAMTAGAIVEMLGGNPVQVENAASLALQGAIGWPCDPVPGGQGTPCTSRTLYILTMPEVYAQWALMGAELVIPFHEVLDSADKAGRNLPSELLCTGRGGLCATRAGRRCMGKFREFREFRGGVIRH